MKVHKETPVRAAACQLSHDYCGDLAQLEGATVSEAVVAARRLTSDALLRFTARAPFARRSPTNGARAEDGDFHEGEWRGVSRKLSARRQERTVSPKPGKGPGSLLSSYALGGAGAGQRAPGPSPSQQAARQLLPCLRTTPAAQLARCFRGPEQQAAGQHAARLSQRRKQSQRGVIQGGVRPVPLAWTTRRRSRSGSALRLRAGQQAFVKPAAARSVSSTTHARSRRLRRTPLLTPSAASAAACMLRCPSRCHSYTACCCRAGRQPR